MLVRVPFLIKKTVYAFFSGPGLKPKSIDRFSPGGSNLRLKSILVSLSNPPRGGVRVGRGNFNFCAKERS